MPLFRSALGESPELDRTGSTSGEPLAWGERGSIPREIRVRGARTRSAGQGFRYEE